MARVSKRRAHRCRKQGTWLPAPYTLWRKPAAVKAWRSTPTAVTNYMTQAHQAEQMMRAHYNKLKAEGWTEQVPGYPGVLVSPDGNSIMEVG